MHKLGNFLKKIFNKTFILIAIVLAALAVFFYWGWFEKQFDKAVGMYYVNKGDKEYRKGELQHAIDYYNKGLVLYPEHYTAHYNLGNIYVVYEDFYSAAEEYEKSIEIKPDFTMARMNLGIISTEELGDFDGAIRQYQAIIDKRKHLWFIPFIFNNTKSEKINRGLAYYNMGVAYREKSLYEEDKQNSPQNLVKAVHAYKNAARILKKDYDTRYNLAIAYHLLGDYQNAGLNYCDAIEIKPMDYEAHYNLAILLRHLKMYKEAYYELEKANILIANDSSNSNLSSYVFDVWNDVSKSIIINNGYNYLVENVDDEPSGESITYVHGKVVASDDFDRAMLKNFKTCKTKDFFKEYE